MSGASRRWGGVGFSDASATDVPCPRIADILNYLDRNNIAAARLYGIVEDTGLVGTEYQTVISVLFASYILFQVPSNMVAARVSKPGIYLNICMAGWGIVSAATAAAQNFTGLIIIRLVLGVFEVSSQCGALLHGDHV